MLSVEATKRLKKMLGRDFLPSERIMKMVEEGDDSYAMFGDS